MIFHTKIRKIAANILLFTLIVGAFGQSSALNAGLKSVLARVVPSKKNFLYTTGAATAFYTLYQLYAGYRYRSLMGELQLNQHVPIVYHPDYNISVGRALEYYPFGRALSAVGLDKVVSWVGGWIHPFDGEKYERVMNALLADGFFRDLGRWHEPAHEISQADLLTAHPQVYLNSLRQSETIADVISIPVSTLPPELLDNAILQRMRLASQGTLDAFKLALQHGWGWNMGAGFHHASAVHGSGFCPYADAFIACKKFLALNPGKKVLYVDADAHQGNGFERLTGDSGLGQTHYQGIQSAPDNTGESIVLRNRGSDQIRVFDVYHQDWVNGRRAVYPHDRYARLFIDYDHPIQGVHYSSLTGALLGYGDRSQATSNEEYLRIFSEDLPRAIDEYHPDVIFYNAGTDPIAGDLVGRLNMSEECLVSRDETVFHAARSRGIPIVVVTSGGYTSKSWRVITASLKNLRAKGLLNTQHPATPFNLW